MCSNMAMATAAATAGGYRGELVGLASFTVIDDAELLPFRVLIAFCASPSEDIFEKAETFVMASVDE